MFSAPVPVAIRISCSRRRQPRDGPRGSSASAPCHAGGRHRSLAPRVTHRGAQPGHAQVIFIGRKGQPCQIAVAETAAFRKVHSFAPLRGPASPPAPARRLPAGRTKRPPVRRRHRRERCGHRCLARVKRRGGGLARGAGGCRGGRNRAANRAAPSAILSPAPRPRPLPRAVRRGRAASPARRPGARPSDSGHSPDRRPGCRACAPRSGRQATAPTLPTSSSPGCRARC